MANKRNTKTIYRIWGQKGWKVTFMNMEFVKTTALKTARKLFKTGKYTRVAVQDTKTEKLLYDRVRR